MTDGLTDVPLPSPTIVLVTVLFNCAKHLPLFFTCLGRQGDRDFVVVVVDNDSKDDSLVAAQSLSRQHQVSCEFIANKDNLGIAVGNNQGIAWAQARGHQHVVLINNDIGCDDDLVAAVRRQAIHAGHRAWTCLAYHGDSQKRWYGGGHLSYWRARGMHWGQQRSEAVHAPQSVSYAPTCLMYVHASVFDRVGIMDAKYFVYYDDTDFCRRMHDAGIQLQYDPTVSFKHYVGGSSGGEMSPFFMRISTRNKFIYIRKHYAGWRFCTVYGLSLVLKLVQLLSPKRRTSTWQGLRDAWRIGP